MSCARNDEASGIIVPLNGEFLEKVQCFKYLSSHGEKIEQGKTEVKYIIKEGCKFLCVLKGVIRGRTMGI